MRTFASNMVESHLIITATISQKSAEDAAGSSENFTPKSFQKNYLVTSLEIKLKLIFTDLCDHVD